MACICHHLNAFCAEHNRYTDEANTTTEAAAPGAEDTDKELLELCFADVSPGHIVEPPPPVTVRAPFETDLQTLFGMRAAPAMPVAAPVTGRIIDGGIVHLKPYQSKEDRITVDSRSWTIPSDQILAIGDPVLATNAPRPQLLQDIAAASCRCDQPATFGHDTDCASRTIQPAPLQLLLSAAQLIPNQPTTEQWQTIKEAIRGLVPSPHRS